MITAIYGRWAAKQVTCDNCGDGFEADSYFEARDALKSEGWKTKFVDGHYKHYCPDCREDTQ